jgi:hypothetical protein
MHLYISPLLVDPDSILKSTAFILSPSNLLGLVYPHIGLLNVFHFFLFLYQSSARSRVKVLYVIANVLTEVFYVRPIGGPRRPAGTLCDALYLTSRD